MNDKPRYIAKPPVLKPAEDFYRLRQEGISFIEEMGSQLWTDYNAHDPGITILEAFCYAITELGYRTGWDIKDLLTPDPAKKRVAPLSQQQGTDEQENSSFFRAGQILPVNPVTPDDFRRLLIGLDGIRNAWITAVECDLSSSEDFDCCEKQEKDKKRKSNPNETKDDPPVCGLYDVLLELEERFEKGTDKHTEKTNEVKRLLHSHRNLCEDYCSINTVETENVALCAKIDLRPDADIEVVQAHVMHEIEKYFSPPIPFRSLQELLDADERVEDIFNGPIPTGGFIKAADLKAASLREVLNVSDLINILMDIDGIIAIRHPKLIKYDDKGNIEKNTWRMSIRRQHKPKLYRAENHITFYKNGVPFQKDFRECDDMVNQLFGETERSQDETAKKDEPPDLPVPTGTFRNLNEYFPVQYSLPTTHGIGPDGLPAQASE
ncbi:MAG: hypothetical protein D3922_10820, partial [Candidatus Electrothrix sp. AR1]|nr:hypothetical protein [Candidatus Electrothrix sp. AR1]